MIIRKHDEVKNVQWGNGTSHRFLLEADGMGYTLTDTIVKAGTKSLIEYENHLEACYCIAGKGSVIEMDGTEHEIVEGTMYALDNRDPHYLVGSDEEDMRLVCTFTPALKGDEAHDFNADPAKPSHY
jgi:L-ectoine synthase